MQDIVDCFTDRKIKII